MGSPPSTAEIQQQQHQQHQNRCGELWASSSTADIRPNNPKITSHEPGSFKLVVSTKGSMGQPIENSKCTRSKSMMCTSCKVLQTFLQSPTLFFEVSSVYQSCIFRGTLSSFRRTLHLGQVYVAINWRRAYQMSIESAYITSIIAFMRQLQVNEDP